MTKYFKNWRLLSTGILVVYFIYFLWITVNLSCCNRFILFFLTLPYDPGRLYESLPLGILLLIEIIFVFAFISSKKSSVSKYANTLFKITKILVTIIVICHLIGMLFWVALFNFLGEGLGNVQLSTLKKEKKYNTEVEHPYTRLLAHANENNFLDNPSPYIIDQDDNQIDLGHLLFGLDGLINNGTGADYSADNTTTSSFFEAYGMTQNNTFTGFVADVFTPATEADYHNVMGEISNNAPQYPRVDYTDDLLDDYYQISAPEADLLSDIDPFGMYEIYKQDKSQSLSEIFRKFYHPANPTEEQTSYKKRFTIFCKQIGVLDSNDQWLPNIDLTDSVSDELLSRGRKLAQFWLAKILREEK